MNDQFSLRKGLSFLGFAAVLTAAPVWADDGTGAAEAQRPERHDWRQLDDRLRAVEEEVKARPPATAGDLLAELRQRASINGLVEAEGFHRKGYARDTESDLTLATVALDVHAELTDWARTHILLLWEEDATEPVDVDEAVISLGNPEKFPLSLNAGKMYVPFGAYGSFMIQDPLTLELGETNETAVQIGFEQAGFYGSLYAFNGDVDEAGRDNTINNFGASGGYVIERDGFGLNLGIDYLNNLADSDGITGALGDSDVSPMNDYVAGLGAHLQLTYGPCTFFSEYVAALDEFTANEIAFQDGGAKPEAWHLEVGYTRELFGKGTTFAVGYQATDEAIALELPENRYLAAVNVAVADGLFWTLEYVHDKDYSASEGGTGDDADMITTQLAFEF
jgi:hypothetical protein